MSDNEEPDILVQRLHQLSVKHGLSIKDFAVKCGIPKSSLEGYMRLKGAKRPGIDALLSISKTMGVSIDWLTGNSQEDVIGDDERQAIALAVYRLLVEVLRDIDRGQKGQTDHVVSDGKIGNRPIEDYAMRMVLYFNSKAEVFPQDLYSTDRFLKSIGNPETGNE